MKKIYRLKKFKSKEEWLNERKIGGSSAAAILNLSPYVTANELYDSIVYPKPRMEVENDAILRGTLMEPLIRKLFAILYQDKYIVKSPPKYNWSFYRKDKKWMTASLDGILIDKVTNEKGILEIKTKECRSQSELTMWENGKIPDHYFTQVLHYFNTTGFKYAVIVGALFTKNYDTNEIKSFNLDVKVLQRDDFKKDLEYLEKCETTFYQNCKKRIRPKIYINILKKEK